MIYCKQEQLKFELRDAGSVTLSLKRSYSGEITLMAKENNGNSWSILSIKERTPITLHSSCPYDFFIPVEPGTGIPLTKKEEGFE